jgi:hypothetical protein
MSFAPSSISIRKPVDLSIFECDITDDRTHLPTVHGSHSDRLLSVVFVNQFSVNHKQQTPLFEIIEKCGDLFMIRKVSSS